MSQESLHGGNTREHAEKLGIDEQQLLDFSANINPLGMPDSLKRAITNHLAKAECYPDPAYKKLHQALADFHHCPADYILTGNGATESIFAIISQLKPKSTLLLTPSFAEYRRALEKYHCPFIEYQLAEKDNFRPDHRLLEAITPDIDCLFLCSPNNPTGQRIEADLLAAIAERCQQLHIWLIVDEAFIDFVGEHFSLIPQLNHYPQLVILRSLTKFFAIPGLRLGYLLSANPQLIQQLRAQQQPWSINCFAELAGLTILQDHTYMTATHQWLAHQQAYLYPALQQFSQLRVYPPAANYIFLRCKDKTLDLQKALLQQHILIRDCANYPGLSQGYYRVAIKDQQANQRLIEGLNNIFC